MSEERVTEAWREGYDAAVEHVRLAAPHMPGRVAQVAVAGLAKTLDRVRDDAEAKWSRVQEANHA